MDDEGQIIWAPLGLRHGPKRDLDRNGLFAEMTYLHGAPWEPPIQFVDNRDNTIKQMVPYGPSMRTGLSDIYFEKTLKRLFIGEGINWRPPPDDAYPRLEPVFFQYKPWYPPKTPIKMRFRGEAWGTIEGNLSSVSPRIRAIQEEEGWAPRGVFTQPGKKGNAGYVDIGLSPYPEHMPCKYEPKDIYRKKKKNQVVEEEKAVYSAPLVGCVYPGYFDPNPFYTEEPFPPNKKFKSKEWFLAGKWVPSSPAKKDGGCKRGTIGNFPEWIPEKYVEPRHQLKELEKIKEERDIAKGKKVKKKPKKPPKVIPIVPPACSKQFFFKSSWKAKIDSSVNEHTWATLKPLTFKKKFLVAK